MITQSEVIVVTPNYTRRTFTIRTYINGKFFAKYRTTPFTRAEFKACLYDTVNDWKNYLRTSFDYYKV